MNQQERGVLDSGPVSVGEHAPDFELPALVAGVRGTFRLSSCRGKWVVLAFYPFNWQDASIHQMKGYQSHRAQFLAAHAEIVGVTVESIMNTTAWERHHGPFDFPLCSDFWPHGEVCRRYGVLRESGTGAGACDRAIVVVDPGGRIVARESYPLDQVPPIAEVLAALQNLEAKNK